MLLTLLKQLEQAHLVSVSIPENLCVQTLPYSLGAGGLSEEQSLCSFWSFTLIFQVPHIVWRSSMCTKSILLPTDPFQMETVTGSGAGNFSLLTLSDEPFLNIQKMLRSGENVCTYGICLWEGINTETVHCITI